MKKLGNSQSENLRPNSKLILFIFFSTLYKDHYAYSNKSNAKSEIIIINIINKK